MLDLCQEHMIGPINEKKLTPSEEPALVSWVGCLVSSSDPLTPNTVLDTARSIRLDYFNFLPPPTPPTDPRIGHILILSLSRSVPEHYTPLD